MKAQNRSFMTYWKVTTYKLKELVQGGDKESLQIELRERSSWEGEKLRERDRAERESSDIAERSSWKGEQQRWRKRERGSAAARERERDMRGRDRKIAERERVRAATRERDLVCRERLSWERVNRERSSRRWRGRWTGEMRREGNWNGEQRRAQFSFCFSLLFRPKHTHLSHAAAATQESYYVYI